MGLSDCNKQGFYDYFLENMEALDLPAPRSLFATQATVLATINQLSAVYVRHSRSYRLNGPEGKMKGVSMLLLVGLVCAGVAWLLWIMLGWWAFIVFGFFGLLTFLPGRPTLRERLEQKREAEGSGTAGRR